MQNTRTSSRPCDFHRLEDVQHVGVAAGDAERREACSTHVLDQGQTAGFEPIRRHLRKSRGDGTRGRDVSPDHAGRLCRGVALIEPLTKSGDRARPARFRTP